MSTPTEGPLNQPAKSEVPDEQRPDVVAPGEPAPFKPELPRWATKAANATPLTETRLAAYIGKKWAGTYRRKLMPFVSDPAFTPSWNWAAAFGWPFWFLYRKLYLAFAGFYLTPGLVLRWLTGSTQQLTLENASSPENKQLMLVAMAVFASCCIAAGGTANWLLFRRARAATMVVTLQQLPEEASLALLSRIGGVNVIPTILFAAVSFALSMAVALAPAM